MTKTERNNVWLKIARKRRRDALLKKMGGACQQCGQVEKLEFHHPYGRDWIARSMNPYLRMNHYERDFAEGNLELLCKSCNAKTLPRPRPGELEPLEELPF